MTFWLFQSYFKRLNQNIQRPVLPTESSNKLLRHIDGGARFFTTIDLTNGYHQNPINKESQDPHVISTTMGRFKYLVLAQEVCSASDIFNFLTDGSIRYDGSRAIKNKDNVLLYGRTLEELKTKLETFLGFCEEKNLKLK